MKWARGPSTSPRPIAPGEVLAVFGRRGAGKTTLARRLVAPARRLVAWDPLGEWSRFTGMTRADSVAELRDQLRRRWRTSFRVALVPSGDLVASLDALARFLWAAQEPFPAAPCGPVVLVVDEANLGVPNHKLGRRCWGMSRLALQGRHRGVGLVLISQRPALVSLDARAQAHRTFAFALTAPADRRALAGQFGAAAEELATLPPRRFLSEENGSVARCGPVHQYGPRATANAGP